MKAKSMLKPDMILFVVMLAVTALCIFPFVAHAGDSGFSLMGPTARHLIATSPDNIATYGGTAGDRANEMPDGYLMWTASGDPAYIRRNTTSLAIFEASSLKIPADKEIIITPFGPIRISTTYFNSFEVVGTAGDTLLYIPLWR